MEKLTKFDVAEYLDTDELQKKMILLHLSKR